MIEEQEWNDVLERLARIEQNQVHFSRQLDKVVALLDRMVKVEEHIESHRYEIDRLHGELHSANQEIKELQKEITKWTTARKIFVWASGSSFVAALAYIIFNEMRKF